MARHGCWVETTDCGSATYHTQQRGEFIIVTTTFKSTHNSNVTFGGNKSESKFHLRLGHWRTWRGAAVQLYCFFNLGDGWGWVVNDTLQPLNPLGKRSGTHGAEGSAGPSASLDGSEDLALTGVRSPHRSIHSELL